MQGNGKILASPWTSKDPDLALKNTLSFEIKHAYSGWRHIFRLKA